MKAYIDSRGGTRLLGGSALRHHLPPYPSIAFLNPSPILPPRPEVHMPRHVLHMAMLELGLCLASKTPFFATLLKDSL